ncbi:MAG: ABC transporter permease [Acidobacteria bacterium]|nr:ABC transporter permease [Acidobacteriota bacterium]
MTTENKDKYLTFRILRRLVSARDADYIDGCFEELYRRKAATRGPGYARAWIWWQILKSLPGFFLHGLFWQFRMLKNYLGMTARHLLKNKGFFLIKVFGLAAGIACSMVVIFYAVNELTYDTYHPDSERIYRLSHRRVNQVGDFSMATTPSPLAVRIRDNLPQAEAVARVIPPLENAGHVLAVQGDRRFFEKRVYFADPDIFRIFSLPMLEGNVRQALAGPRRVVLTASAADRYFGGLPPLGRTLRLELDYDWEGGGAVTEDFQVTGVMADPPPNTHLKMDLLVSMDTMLQHRTKLNTEWMNPHTQYTYVKLRPGVDPQEFEKQLIPFAEEYKAFYKAQVERELPVAEYHMQPVRSIHMGTTLRQEPETPGNVQYLYIYSIAALLILLVGVLNFVNLSATLSVTRTREVGIRKTVGGRRFDLILQFLSESYIVTLLAFALSIGFLSLLLQYFNEMAGTELSLDQIRTPVILAALLGLFLVVGLAAGAYPALVLSAFRPVTMLRNELAPGARGSAVQRLLVVGQFAVAIFLVVCTLVVFHQLEFMKGKSLGFDREQKLILEVRSDQAHLRKDYEAIKADFRSHPGILGATVSSSVPGEPIMGGYYLRSAGAEEGAWENRLKVLTVDEDFLALYGIRMVAGRPFDRERGDDVATAYLVNEAGAREMGVHPEALLGRSFFAHYHRETKQVVGVTADFHFMGMKEATEPLILDIENSLFRVLTVAIDRQQAGAAMEHVRDVWQSHFPEAPFEYYFLDEAFGKVYRYEEEMGRLLAIITSLGISVAFLGLFGLVTFITRLRRKEIGIRRVLGASPASIVLLLSRNFILLVVLAGLMAIPAAWAAMERWLQDFAYRVQPEAPVFIFAMLAAVLIAMTAVIFQGWRAAGEKPVDTLRSE